MPPSPEPSSTGKWTRIVAVIRRVASNELVMIAAVVALFTWYILTPTIWFFVTETDWWWHMRTGEWIMQHHQLPHTDPFSITGAHKAWVAYSWPFEIFLYEVVNRWDLLGVSAVTALNWMGMTLAMFSLVRSFKPPFWVSAGFALIGSFVVQRVVAARPGPITVICFCFVLQLLFTAHRSGSVRRLWLLPIILWGWANVHVQFVYGLFVIGLFCMLPVFDRLLSYFGSQPATETGYLSQKWMWGTLAISTAMTFVNPYGVGIYQVLWDFIKQPKLYTYINETRAMAFDRKVHFVVLIAALAAAYVLGRKRRIEPLWTILLLWGAVMSFHAERDLWLVTVIAFALLAQHIAKTFPETRAIQPRVWLAAFACVLIIVAVRFKSAPSSHELRGIVSNKLPLGAVAYIHEHHLKGPIYNDFDWGGFLIYAMPEMPVVIDGRTNVHGQDEIARSLQTWNVLGDNWYDDPLLQQANLVIGDPQYALTYALRVDPHFKEVFHDRTAMLYQRVLPPTLAPQEKPSK